MARALEPTSDSATGSQLQCGCGNTSSTVVPKAPWSAAALLLLSSFLWGVAEKPCWAQEKPSGKLLFLVARSPVIDPFFAQSVVLMVPTNEDALVVGLVVNKPSRLPLTKLFPESPTLKNRTDNAYVGGPVDMAAPALVFHSSKPSKQAILLYDDVYLSFDPKFITKVLRDPKQTGDLRFFLGRAQWAPQQLQGEALEGSWYSLRAEGDVIFDRDSEHVWKRLHDRAGPPPSTNPISLPQVPKGEAGCRASLTEATTAALPSSQRKTRFSVFTVRTP